MKYLLAIVFIGLGTNIFAQQQERIQFISINEKLSQNTVTCILQDKKGFLWLGTRNGLNKYDGVNIHIYEGNNSSLSNAYIKDIFEDTQGIIWIGSFGGGLYKYNVNTDSFHQYIHDENVINSISGNSVSVIFQDHDGVIWVGTENGGLNKFDIKGNKFIYYKHNKDDPFSISSNNITDIEEDDEGNLWIGTWGGGLNLFDEKSSRFIHYFHDPSNQKTINSNDVNRLVKGKNRNIWVATQQGLNRLHYDNKSKYVITDVPIGRKTEIIEHKVILSVLEEDDKLWVGTENGGIRLIDLQTNEIEYYTYNPKYKNSILSNSIWSLFKDNTGIIWVGTFNKGLFKVDSRHQKFPHFIQNPYNLNSISDNSISSFAEDQEGNLWIGTDGGGLNYWNIKLNKYVHYKSAHLKPGSLRSDAVLSLLLDDNEDLWVGTWQGGVNILRKGGDFFEHFDLGMQNINGDYKGNIMFIIKDNKGRIWISDYRNGVFVYDQKTKILTHLMEDGNNPRSLNSNLVRTIFEDREGTIWIGTEGGGLNKCIEQDGNFYFDHFVHDINDEKSISNNIIMTSFEDSKGNLWIGTSGGLDLMNRETNEFTKFGKKQGFPNEVIYGILEDSENNLWISTNNGLVRWIHGDNSIAVYDESDGLQSLEFSKNAYLKLKNGELLFGGINGFNKFLPSSIKDNESSPPVYITGFDLSNKRIYPTTNGTLTQNIITTEKIELNYEQNDLSFEFAILNFSRPEKSVYAYQLNNYDEDWQEVGTRRYASYTNVPPGHYIFRVKATNSNGKWSDNMASIEILVSPPWYNTYWAYSIFIIIITGLLVLGIQIVVNRERLQNQIKIDHLEISNMQEANQMKTRFFANISHEFRSPLTLILGPLKSLSDNPAFESSKKQISMMIRNAQRLLDLINQLLELSKIEAGHMKLEATENDIISFVKPIVHSFNSLASKKYIAYKVELPNDKIKVYFDKEKLEKIVINLISNAIKYTPEFGEIIVKIIEKNKEVVFEVNDNGIGIPKEEMEFVFNRYYRINNKESKASKGTGIGLSLSRELVNLHKGRIELESEENSGAVFRVYLQLGKDHLSEEEILEHKSEFLYENSQVQIQENDFTELTKTNDIEDELEGFPIILVIEDNKDIRTYVTEILGESYRVLQADNGSDGLKLALENIPDLIISDIMMPGLDGYELCRKVKSDLKTSHIPVVLLTAKASNDSALTGFEMGADYFIIKPFNSKILLLRIKNMLKSRDLIKENLLKDKTINLDPKNIKINAKDEGFLKKAVEVVELNMENSNFYVDDLGKELGLSRMQLYRKLKGLIGQSANEFTRSIRLKRAVQLIEQRTLTISEITYEVGFTDLQYFRDCFKKQFGVNPTEYLKNLKK